MTYEFKNGQLPILISARVRISPEQRRALKDAYFQRKNAAQPPDTVGTGGLTVSTAYGSDKALERELGMSHLVFSDLINSRDSIGVNIILQIQKALGVEIISRDKLMESMNNYADWIFKENE